MRRLGFVVVVAALVSVSSIAVAEAPAAAPPAPETAGQPPLPSHGKRVNLRRVSRVGSTTAGAHGFLPLLFPFAAFAGFGAAATVAVTQSGTPVSPQ